MRLLKALKSKVGYKTKKVIVKPKKVKMLPKKKITPSVKLKPVKGKKVPMTQKFKDGFKNLVKKVLKKKGMKRE